MEQVVFDVDASGLFDEANGILEGFHTKTLQASLDMEELGAGIHTAIEGLVTKLCARDSLHAKVKAAARVGARHIDLLRFYGSELDEVSGFPMLTLVKGPRDRDLKRICPSSLMNSLSFLLRPFAVHHIWHSRTNLNRIVLQWGLQQSPAQYQAGELVDPVVDFVDSVVDPTHSAT